MTIDKSNSTIVKIYVKRYWPKKQDSKDNGTKSNNIDKTKHSKITT